MDFIEKHYDEVMKKSNQETKIKSVLPCVVSVQAKVQKLVDHRVKEREKEQAKNKSAHKESNKENLNSNINSLPSSARKSTNGMEARSSNHGKKLIISINSGRYWKCKWFSISYKAEHKKRI